MRFKKNVFILGASSDIGISIMKIYLKNNYEILAHFNKGNSNFFNFVKNKDIKTILDSQKKAFTKVLDDKKIPFREFNFNKLNEETIGELFSYFIIETVLIGKLIGVNPYNQPAVEEIKVLTKKYLT